MEKEKALITKPEKQILKTQEITTNNLLEMAINKDLDTQKLEKLIELKTKEEERFYKREFDFHFAEMQKDFIPVQKNREVKNKKGEYLYEYCTLNNLLKIYQPIISDHGFSYRWDEEIIKEGKEKRISIIVSGYGHEIKSSIDIPILPGNDFTNSTQQRGSSTTYGKRYSFKNIFGIIEDDDEDDDANAANNNANADEKELTIVPSLENENPQIATPGTCIVLINKLKNTGLKIQFVKRYSAVLAKFKGNDEAIKQKVAILVKYITDEKRHNSASFLNELDTELWGKTGVAG